MSNSSGYEWFDEVDELSGDKDKQAKQLLGDAYATSYISPIRTYDKNLKVDEKYIETLPDLQNGPSSLIQGAPVAPEVYQQLLRSYDEGIAEFLDLESVKPNTLGNTRMLKVL